MSTRKPHVEVAIVEERETKPRFEVAIVEERETKPRFEVAIVEERDERPRLDVEIVGGREKRSRFVATKVLRRRTIPDEARQRSLGEPAFATEDEA